MKTYCYYHADCEAHDPGPQHSERSERLTEIVRALKNSSLPELEWHEAPLGDRHAIERVHKKNYVDFVFKSIPQAGYQQIEEDSGEVTTLSPRSVTPFCARSAWW
jgi:acetoin utilization deacetylase AcuC-like enzyme